MNRKFFALKLIPPRATFGQDMNNEERTIMQQHVQYWTEMMNDGQVVAFGPVLDPEGAYGLGILIASDDNAVKSIIDADPANGLNRYEYHQMLAVIPSALLQK